MRNAHKNVLFTRTRRLSHGYRARMARPRIIVALAVIAIVLGVASPAFADRTVRGTVRDDATGLPIAGALVTVGIGETTTDENGAFTVGDVPFGRVDVLVIADDYATYFGSAR